MIIDEKARQMAKYLSQCNFAYHKSHTDYLGTEPGSAGWESQGQMDWAIMLHHNHVVTLLYVTFFKTEFQTFFHGGTHKINFMSIWTHTCENENKDPVSRTRRLVQYCQLLAKNSSNFKGHQEIFAMFRNSYLFIPRFFAEHLTMFRGTLIFRGTLVGTNCSRLNT